MEDKRCRRVGVAGAYPGRYLPASALREHSGRGALTHVAGPSVHPSALDRAARAAVRAGSGFNHVREHVDGDGQRCALAVRGFCDLVGDGGIVTAAALVQ
jgi:hypothetical protein